MRVTELQEKTDFILPDEKAVGLQEVDLLTDDYKETHRYQIIYVIRNDKPAKYITDLGLSLRYPNPPLNIYAALEHSVAELQDMAEDARDRSNVVKRIAELQEESSKEKSIIKEFLEQKDRDIRIRKNRSHHGPSVTVQRIGYRRK